MNFNTALFVKKYFFIERHVPTLYELSALKLDKADRRSLILCLRYATVFYDYLQKNLGKIVKKSAFNLGSSFLMLGMEELLVHKQPLYAISHQIGLMLKKAKLSWAVQPSIALLKSMPTLEIMIETYLISQNDSTLIGLLRAEHPSLDPRELFTHPPMWVRVDNNEAFEQIPEHLILEKSQLNSALLLSGTSHELEILFQEGKISYQDLASQALIEIASILPYPSKVIDCCAAPGGKSSALMKLWPKAEFFLTDNDPKRLSSLDTNIQRVSQNFEYKVNTSLHSWDLSALDVKAHFVLVDAPCSGTGVIRRHPDILWNRTPSMLQEFAVKQLAILTQAAKSVAPDGYLIYSTCSLSSFENDRVIESFLQEHPSFDRVSFSLNEGNKTALGMQLVPSAKHDGLYYSLLKKSNT